MKFFLLTFLCIISLTVEERVRIIGGQPGSIGQFPFVAAINVQTANSRFFCGGTFFKNQWIITAGQCVDGAILFTINLGSVLLDGSSRVKLATSEYVLHPDYNGETLENDIALIKLRMPVAYTEFIQPIPLLATQELPAKPNLRAIGWGQISDANSSLSNQLNYVYVSSLSNDECKITYGNQITDTMVCVEGNYNEGACHGDTGGPLLDLYSKYIIHVGVSSFVSANGCESTDPSGYTRTYPYVDWIMNVTSVTF